MEKKGFISEEINYGNCLWLLQSSAAQEAEAKAKQAAEREKMKFMMDQKKLLEEQLAKVSRG